MSHACGGPGGPRTPLCSQASHAHLGRAFWTASLVLSQWRRLHLTPAAQRPFTMYWWHRGVTFGFALLAPFVASACCSPVASFCGWGFFSVWAFASSLGFGSSLLRCTEVVALSSSRCRPARVPVWGVFERSLESSCQQGSRHILPMPLMIHA
jgi:hypothetical protein